MARDPADIYRDSAYFGRFAGIRNTEPDHALSQARVTAGPDDPVELEKGVNIDISDSLKVRRRRGLTKVATGDYHSLWSGAQRTFVVKDGALGLLNADFSFRSLRSGMGADPVSFAEIGPITYFASRSTTGKVLEDETVADWGIQDGAGQWVSPVTRPTDNVGEIRGKFLHKPPNATSLTEWNGRIYLAEGNMVWRTEAFLPDHVDPTKGFFQFESDVTALGRCSTGVVVGTKDGTYLLYNVRGSIARRQLDPYATVPGTMVQVDPKVVGEEARSSEGVMYMTNHGVCAVVGDGVGYNVTEERVILPDADRGAGLFRQQDGINQYVGNIESGGSPTSKARIGDYVEAEIRRFQGG